MKKHDRGVLAPPEPWDTIQQIGFWGEWVASRVSEMPSEFALAEMRDALKTISRDLLNVAKVYRADNARGDDIEHELVPRYMVMTIRDDGSVMPHWSFPDEREAEAEAERAIREPNAVKHAFVRKQWIPVALERLNDTMAKIVAASGMTEDELADAVATDTGD